MSEISMMSRVERGRIKKSIEDKLLDIMFNGYGSIEYVTDCMKPKPSIQRSSKLRCVIGLNLTQYSIANSL